MQGKDVKDYIAVFDETGTSSRPQSVEESGFGVGAIICPLDLVGALAAISKQIGATVNKEDFKYKHVRNSEAARELFLKALNGTNSAVNLFAFYAHGACMVHERQRTKAVARGYGAKNEQPSSPTGGSSVHFDSFLTYTASCICAHAATNSYSMKVYWDRRTDMDQIKRSFDKLIALQSDTLRWNDVDRLVSFCGPAPMELVPIARIAGVLAGDVWKYFVSHGHRIWSKLDPSGLPGVYDYSGVNIDDPSITGPTHIASIREPLADSEPSRLTATVMLQGYYKRFLKRETNEHLISFGDPNGHLGALGIVHGNHWNIYQLPD